MDSDEDDCFSLIGLTQQTFSQQSFGPDFNMLRSILESENIDLGRDQETTNYTTTTGQCEGSEVRQSTSIRII
jgi:hypothetical protein